MIGGPKIHHERRRELGKAFEDGAEHYNEVRPGYPLEIAQWLVPEGARRAADLGAGTGKFTARLVELGLEVSAVDPSDDMLMQLRLVLPTVSSYLGTAESTGLSAQTFQVVTVAQAWHWVDPHLASEEVARILTPGGVLGLVWNQLDTTIPWVHRLSRIMHAGDVLKPDFRPAVGSEFAALESLTIHWADPLTPVGIIELAKSRSFYLSANDKSRERMLHNLHWYLYEHLGYSPTDSVHLPYRCHAWRTLKL
ncbi:class I SAM-dependent methyltransferase [Pseudarthrobacter sp. J1763]|uniref:class I SAM-dependent methyltransferase n=1 Tax=Pseudarthrobacter sp. J1763 TaxID=3420445 RepID=UPI003D2AD4ED